MVVWSSTSQRWFAELKVRHSSDSFSCCCCASEKHLQTILFLRPSFFSANHSKGWNGSTKITRSVFDLCAVTCTDTCAHIKNSVHSAIPLFGHTEMLHTLIGMDSIALAAALLYLGKGTHEFPARENEVIKNPKQPVRSDTVLCWGACVRV